MLDSPDGPDRSGKGSDGASLGPARLAFDKYGLVPRARFDAVLEAVTEADLAFAAMAEREGLRAAALHWMRDDATVFDPGPARAGEVYGALDPDDQPALRWTPLRVEVSSAGDVAVTTGPYRLETARGGEVRHGHYLSVWQRQEDGQWRIVADTGVRQPTEPETPETVWGHRVEVRAPRIAVVPEAMPLVRGLEEGLEEAATEAGWIAALVRRAAPDVHLLHEGVPVRVGRDFLEADLPLSAEQSPLSTELVGAVAATSNDFAVGWGTMRSEDGHRSAFVRVWRREDRSWLVAFDLRAPIAD